MCVDLYSVHVHVLYMHLHTYMCVDLYSVHVLFMYMYVTILIVDEVSMQSSLLLM